MNDAFRRRSPSIRPAILAGVFLALSWTTGTAQRVRLDPAEAVSNSTPPRLSTRLSRPENPVTHYGYASEEESKVPFELTSDPKPGIPGDEWATAPLPAYLKGNPYRLSYVGGDYTPPAGEKIDPLLAAAWRNKPDGRTWGFVMFQGGITASKMKSVEATGVKLGNFHTFNCYTAVIPFSAVPALAGNPAVRWIGFARPWQKVEPDLKRVHATRPGTEKRFLFVNVYESDMTPDAKKVPMGRPAEETGDQTVNLLSTATIPNGPFQALLEKEGCRIVSYYDDLLVFAVEAPLSSIPAIASLEFVHYMELCLPPEPDHDRSTRQIGVDTVRGVSAGNGASTVVGLLDSGAYLGGGRHLDLAKWGVGWNFGGTASPWNDTNGHGTHVLGTICGTGTANNRYKGCAPSVGSTDTTRIFVGRIYDAANYPNNTLTAFSTFKNSYTFSGKTTPRPQVINCSWGYGSRNTLGYTGTDNISLAVDLHVYYYGQTYVFSGSNTGGTSYTNEYFKSIRRPNVAKNAFTVGSVVDYRFTSGSTTVEVGRPWYSSGKGPTKDGRLKPNISAPGRFIRSCKTLTTNQYTDMSGTSMAAPHITGVIAGVMSHYTFFKYKPYLAKAWLAATSNPYADTRTWASSSPSYYYRQGLGQVDAYKAHYQINTTNKGFQSGWNYGTLTSSSAGAYFEVTVPSDAKRTLFVLNFDEKQASAGASRACLADLDLYLDVYPFSSGYNTGEYHSNRAWDTWEWYGNLASISAVRGKKVRVKIFPRVKPAPGTTVKYAVCFIFPKGDTTPSGTVTASTSAAAVRPNQVFTLTATENVPSCVQTNSYLELSTYAGYSVLGLGFKTPDGLVRSYTSSTLYGVGDSLLNWTMGHQGFWYSTTHRRLTWTLRKSTTGLASLCVRLRSDNRTGTYTACRSVCVDGTAPNLISGLTSTNHSTSVWSNNPSLAMKWKAPTDVGCAGIKGLAYKLSLGSPSTPTVMNITGAATAKTVTLSPSTSGWYFNLRAVDKVNYFSPGNRYAGPYYIDTTKPVVTSVVINNGATYTSSLNVVVKGKAVDSYSGPYYMRYSADNSTWSGWFSYTTANRSINLSSYGGNTNEGIKRVYVQVRDKAANISTSNYDTIFYLRCPVLSGVSPTWRHNVTGGYFRVTGADFLGINRVDFGSKVITSTSPDGWYAGYFRVLSDTVMLVYPPQGLVQGNYDIYAYNAACKSNRVVVRILYPSTRILACPTQLKNGKVLNILASRGNMPANTLTLLTLSASPSPSVIPGLISLSHGGGFGPTFLTWPVLVNHHPVTGVARWVIPTPLGVTGTFYFQAIMIDPANPLVTPLRVSTRDSLVLY